MYLSIGIFTKFYVALLWLMLCFADWPMGVEAKLQRARIFTGSHKVVEIDWSAVIICDA